VWRYEKQLINHGWSQLRVEGMENTQQKMMLAGDISAPDFRLAQQHFFSGLTNFMH
jgi:hypothetical protein